MNLDRDEDMRRERERKQEIGHGQGHGHGHENTERTGERKQEIGHGQGHGHGHENTEGTGERERKTGHGQGHGHGHENTAGKISPKIFIGCALTPELKNHLSKSSTWKQASIEQTALTIISFQEKEYLGIYHSENKITLTELTHLEKMIKDKIQIYCPDLSPDIFKIITFPQIFIS